MDAASGSNQVPDGDNANSSVTGSNTVDLDNTPPPAAGDNQNQEGNNIADDIQPLMAEVGEEGVDEGNSSDDDHDSFHSIPNIESDHADTNSDADESDSDDDMEVYDNPMVLLDEPEPELEDELENNFVIVVRSYYLFAYL